MVDHETRERGNLFKRITCKAFVYVFKASKHLLSTSILLLVSTMILLQEETNSKFGSHFLND